MKLAATVAQPFILPVAVTLALFMATNAWGQPNPRHAQNSLQKLRPTASPLAAKAGSAVNWQRSFGDAQRLSTETGKPIFWYVPTLNDSFMDRKMEIDRYMRAGMFSWPTIIQQLNDNFVPLIAVPQGPQTQQYELAPFKFVEPGFLIIEATGKTMARCNRLTTQHPAWLNSVLIASVQPDVTLGRPASDDRSPLRVAWKLFGDAQFQQCTAYLKLLSSQEQPDRQPTAESQLLRGMCQFRLGDHAAAKKTWAAVGNAFPDDPLAWKAAAESEGFGPFVRGFEVHRQLPAAVYDGTKLPSLTSSAPPGTFTQLELWQRATQFLLGMQRSDGGFVDCDYDFGGTDSLPNVHVAITSICGMALLEANERNIKVRRRPQHDAVELARNFVLDPANWNPNDSDELFWAHAFRVRFLAASIRHGWRGQSELQQAVEGLQLMQLNSGSWYHEYPNPLVTSLALVALDEAKQAGATVDNNRIQRAIKSLSRNRSPGGFLYMDASKTTPAARNLDHTNASAGRLPMCTLALLKWDAANDRSLARAIQTSFDQQSHLIAALKYDDHTSRHDYGGFFFWFDILGRSNAIRSLQNGSQRAKFRQQLHQLILGLPELDGCFVDSHEIGRCYGSAMALLSLSQD